MSWSESSEDVQTQESALLEIERRRERGEVYTKLDTKTGTKLASNFWAQSWQRHLATFEHYAGRLSRGRTCLRKGLVYNYELKAGEVRAEVAGAALFEVVVRVRQMEPSQWAALVSCCAGRIGSTLDLLAGRLSDEVLATLTAPDGGLFPEARDVQIVCSCTDHADVCEHGAAVLYAIGLGFDHDPASFFRLRGVEIGDLIHGAGSTLGSGGSGANVIPDSGLQSVFGIEIEFPPD